MSLRRSVIGCAFGVLGLGVFAMQLVRGSSDAAGPRPDDTAADAAGTRSAVATSSPAGAERMATDEASFTEFGLASLDCGRSASPVAIVEGRAIPTSALCEALAATVGESSAHWSRSGPRLLERLIDATLIALELEARGLRVSEGEVEQALERAGASRATAHVRAEVEARLGLRMLSRPSTTPIDLAALAAERARAPARWARGGHAQLEGYLVRMPVGAGAEVAREAERRARLVLDEVAAGGGALGDSAAGVEPLADWTLESNGLEPALEAAVFSSAGAGGAWLGPIRTRVGWVVVRADEVFLPEERPVAELEAELRRALEARRASEAERDLIWRLRQRATIERLVTFVSNSNSM